MIIIPAIDLKDGKVVRLSQGKFNEITIYSERPTHVAKEWETSGAKLIHVVDLDGAEKGKITNQGPIEEIVKSVKIPVQIGGGIRTKADIKSILGLGVKRVVLSTRTIEDRTFLKEVLEEFNDKVIVSLDCSRGFVTKKGWTEVSDIKATVLAKELEGLGLSALIYTDIARDGTLIGPNLKGIKEMLESVSIPVIASGGISELGDIKKLKDINAPNLFGVIVGKALYERRFYLKDAVDLCLRKG